MSTMGLSRICALMNDQSHDFPLLSNGEIPVYRPLLGKLLIGREQSRDFVSTVLIGREPYDVTPHFATMYVFG